MPAAQAAEGQAAQQHAASQFEAAHRALVADPSIQFELSAPPPPVETPHWLKELGEWIAWAMSPVGRALAWIGSWFPAAPYARILLWSVIALLAVAVAWMVFERVRHGEWRLPQLRRRRAAPIPLAADEPLFEAAPVRAWLREADALASLGRFAEAVHLLLFRSIEDLAKRRPGAVQPALTARELARAPALPPPARERFARIAALVERSLFGARPVDAADWAVARADYADFALAGSWRA